MKIQSLFFSIALAAFAIISQNLYARPRTVCDESSLRAALTNGGLIRFGCDGIIVLSSTLHITTNTVLDGTGHSVVISGGDAVRVFFVATNVDFALTNLTIVQGRQQGTNGINTPDSASAESAYGAGIFNDGGRVTLKGCALSNNVAIGGDGVQVFPLFPPVGGDAAGAAIYNSYGFVSISDTVIASNLCVSGTAGNDALAGAVGGFAEGAGIYSWAGSLNINNTSFFGNLAMSTGGKTSDDRAVAGSALGGAIAVVGGDALLSLIYFSNNATVGANTPAFGAYRGGLAQGGAMYLTNCSARIAHVYCLSNSVRSGTFGRFGTVSPARGGAIYNAGSVSLEDSVLVKNGILAGSGNAQNNQDGGGKAQGGAVYNQGSFTILRSTIMENEATGGPGHLASIVGAPGGEGAGGGIYNEGILRISGSTVVSNRAMGGVGARGFPENHLNLGGRAIGGGVFNNGQFTTTNTTIVSNIAHGGEVEKGGFDSHTYLGGRGGDAGGGGLYNQGTVNLVHATIAANASLGGGSADYIGVAQGGAIFTTNGMSTLQNTIVANSLSGSNSFGPLMDDGNNLSSDASCQFTAPGSLNDTDPLLSPLLDFGGPTPTMALLAGSPAIDKGLAAYCTSTDQRGIARPYGTGCDIGAFESAPPYTVHGLILGSSAVGPITIAQETNVTTVAAPGSYSLSGFAAGIYKITLSASNGVVIPNNRSVTVNSDVVGLDFQAYQLNALLSESYTNQVLHLIFAGASGQTSRMQVTTNLRDWVIIETNSVQADGIFHFYSTNDLTEGSRFFRAVSP